MKNPTISDKHYLAALDIGTSKIAMILGQLQADGSIEILIACTTPSKGLKKGVVINIEDAVKSIQAVITETEMLTDVTVDTVCVGISGSHINSMNCEGMAPIQEDEVSQSDINRAIETAKAIQLPADQMVLHVLPRSFAIDDQKDIKKPIGMSGYRLLANVHMVTGGINPIENVRKCVKRCGLKISDIVLEQLASGRSVLSEDEEELGVCLIDIGGGTSDIVVFTHGAVAHTSVIPVGGDHVSNDISVALRASAKNAEEIKIQYGCALEKLVGSEETIEVPGIAGRPARQMRRQALARVVELRYAELFDLVKRHLREEYLNELAVTGVVVTGGGSKMEGVCELAENVLDMPVRLGRPLQDRFLGVFETVNNPIYATGLGLLLFATDSLEESREFVAKNKIKNAWERVTDWLERNF